MVIGSKMTLFSFLSLKNGIFQHFANAIYSEEDFENFRFCGWNRNREGHKHGRNIFFHGQVCFYGL